MADSTSDDVEELKGIFKKLRKDLGDVLKIEPQYDDDWFLFPFLKNNSFDVEKTAAAVRETIKWRKEQKLNRLIEKEFHEEIALEMPIHTDAKTIEGNIVISLISGRDVDHKGIIERYGRDRYVKYIFQLYGKAEKMALDVIKKAPNPPKMTKETKTGSILICDVGDYSLAQAKSLSVIQTWVETTQAYKKYMPGAFRTVYILNMNKIFAPVMKIMLPWMEGPCLELRLYDDGDMSWKDEIFEQILPSQLRVPFGGTKVDAEP